MLIPVSLPRKLTSLRFTSAFSVMVSVYVMLVVVIECLMDRGTSPTVAEGFKEGKEKSKVTVDGIFNSLPLVIFAYMYQINIPAIYTELEQPDMNKIKKVLGLGTTLAGVGYIMAGMFGYAAFAAGESTVKMCEVFSKGNILQAPYHLGDTDKTPIVIYASLFGICIVVTFATPFCVLPTKDSIEEVSGVPLTKGKNFMWTLIILIVSMSISIFLTQIDVVMAFLGATTNSAIGFILPIVYYWHVEKQAPWYTNMKLASYFFFVFICISSCIELYTLFSRSNNSCDDK